MRASPSPGEPSPTATTPIVGDRRAGRVPDPDVAREIAAAVPAEGHERTGVAGYVAVADLTDADDVRPGEPARADGAEVARELRSWHEAIGGGDDDHTVQHHAAAMAWWQVRTRLPGERAPRELAPPGAPIEAGNPATPRPGALGEVVEAFVAGRVLRVVNYHSTPARLADVVAEEVADYAARYSPVGPADVHRFLDTGRWDTPRPPVLLGFFDGFRDNAEVAAPLCERAGAPAWFHLPTGFLDAPPQEQPAFARRHHIRAAPEEVARGERLAMTWDHVAALAERHPVGAHTARHAMAQEVLDADDLEREVSAPLRRVAEVIGRPADSFAWLGGTPHDAGSPAGRAVEDAGVTWFASGLALERLSPPTS